MSYRVQKVNELLKQELSVMVKESIPEELGLVTVMDVIATPDFKIAHVFISVMVENNEAQIIKILDKKKNGFQKELGRKLKMRYTPKLEFRVDQSKDELNRIDELLEETRK